MSGGAIFAHDMGGVQKVHTFSGDFVMGRTLNLYEISASDRVGKEGLENVWQGLCCNKFGSI